MLQARQVSIGASSARRTVASSSLHALPGRCVPHGLAPFSSAASWGVAAGQATGAPILRRTVVPHATPDKSPRGSEPTTPAQQQGDQGQLLFSLGIGALWIALLAYAFVLAPNQTPYRDQIFIERILGIGMKDGYVVDPVFVGLFNIMGIYPAIYASLLVPAGRSENKIPAWPFITASFFLGAFALLPYMALWRPYSDPDANPLPPPSSELTGWNRLFLRGAETPIMPALLLAGGIYYIGMAVTAGGDAWLEYFKLFDESRLVHVTTVDFATLTALAPFWMENDAAGRKWEQRGTLLPVLSFLPVVGPAIYLLLRPKAEAPK